MIITRWLTFTRERFEPVSHLLMVGLFFAGHLVFLRNSAELDSAPSITSICALGFFALAFFFKLRLYDEIKDFSSDVVLNPNRPLPRRLVTLGEVQAAIVLCLMLEGAIVFLFGSSALTAWLVAAGYSLLMFREFFIPHLIRPHLTTYAVSHTIVCALLTLTLLAALSGRSFSEVPLTYLIFAVNSWALFNVFEFGRKTFSSQEERAEVPSYSNIFGRGGSVALTLSQALISIVALRALTSSGLHLAFGLFCTSLLGALGIGYAVQNTPQSAKLYRTFSSIYIVLIYVGFSLWS
jgi:hypothetical protein